MSAVARDSLCVLLLLITTTRAQSQLINSEWNTGNGVWNVAANWLPIDVPDNGAGGTYAVQIGNRPVAAGAVVTYFPEDPPNDIVSSLTITNGAELFTNSRHLNVFGQTTVEGANSKLRIGPHDNPHAAAFFTHQLALNNGGALLLSGGAVEIANVMQVNAAATLEGPGELMADDIVFEPASNVITSGMLHLNTATTQIDSGAVFSGGGSLHIPVGSHMQLEDGADVGVMIHSEGALSIGLNAAAQATGLGFHLEASGVWNVDIHGFGLAEFDQLNLTGAAQLAGAIQLAIGGGYVPTLGDTFDILSAGGVTGQFASIVQPSGLPADLVFDVRYDPTFVQLIVVNALPGDYNRDGAVDAADYVVWRKMFGQGVSIFTSADGNGDGIIDNDDYNVWRSNFGQTASPGSGAASNPAVPEPSAIYLLPTTLLAFALHRPARSDAKLP